MLSALLRPRLNPIDEPSVRLGLEMTTCPLKVNDARIVATPLLGHDIAGLALPAQQTAHRRFADVKQLRCLHVRAATLCLVRSDDPPAEVDR